MVVLDVFLSLLAGAEALQVWKLMLSYQYSWLEAAARSEIERPFVYRALLPFLSQLLYYTFGGDIVFWLGLLFVGSAIGFYWSMRYFLPENKFLPFAACQMLFVITFVWIKPYDYATAMFFALSLGLLKREKHGVFLFVYLVASLNRETTFLLTLVYAVWFYKRIAMKSYFLYLAIQIGIYVGMKFGLEIMYSQNAGQALYIYALDNISYWYIYVALVSAFFFVWRRTGGFVKVCLAVIVPVQIALFLFFGLPTEFRVFAESVAIMSASLFPYSKQA